MKNLIISLLVVFSSISICQAERFNTDNYEISVSGYQNCMNQFNVEGRIRGPACKEGVLFVYLEGSKGDRFKVKTKVMDLEPAVTRLIDDSFKSDMLQQIWKVTKVKVHCGYADEPKTYKKKSK